LNPPDRFCIYAYDREEDNLLYQEPEMTTTTSWVLILALAFAGSSFGGNQGNGELSLPEGTHIVLQLNDYLSTKLNTEGDRFTATVTVPVYVGERQVIPKGSVISGSISRLVRPGRVKGKAVMNLLFQSLRIPGRGEYPIVASLFRIETEGAGDVRSEGTIVGQGSPGGDAGRVLKPGLTGAGIGVLVGGGRGAAIGTGVGAAVGLGVIFATRGKDLVVQRGSTMDIALDRALTIPADGETAGRTR
jgi:hypothetical protein